MVISPGSSVDRLMPAWLCERVHTARKLEKVHRLSWRAAYTQNGQGYWQAGRNQTEGRARGIVA
jgi:hypothetical protein